MLQVPRCLEVRFCLGTQRISAWRAFSWATSRTAQNPERVDSNADRPASLEADHAFRTISLSLMADAPSEWKPIAYGE